MVEPIVLAQILALVFSVVVHEVAHGWSALMLGDTTARDHGRLTLNPLPHIDPIGSLLVPALMTLAGGVPIGWARPVPVHPGRLRDPRNDHPKVAAAGPVSNLLLAVAAAILLGLLAGVTARTGEAGRVHEFLFLLLYSLLVVNVALAIFNLVPLPPLDGSWILARFLPAPLLAPYEKLRRYGFLPIFALVLLMRYTPLDGSLGQAVDAALGPYRSLADAVARITGP